MKRYYLAWKAQHGERSVNEIVVNEHGVPVMDRYVYMEAPFDGQWYSKDITWSAEYLRNTLTNSRRIIFKCRPQAQKFLGIEEWPND